MHRRRHFCLIRCIWKENYDDIENQYSIHKESTLGAIIYNTGGIIIDGWIRIYGAGELDFAERNMLWAVYLLLWCVVWRIGVWKIGNISILKMILKSLQK